VEEIVNEAETISSNVSSTQEIVELILDSNRNALLALDLKVSIMTLGIGAGALIAGLFGMNLQSDLEKSNWAFVGISIFATASAGLVMLVGLRRLAKIRKVGLSASSVAPSRRPKRKPWLPLPLRRRGPDEWT